MSHVQSQPFGRELPAGATVDARASLLSSYIELTKPGIVKMVLVAAGVGYVLGVRSMSGAAVAPSGSGFAVGALFGMMGTALSAGGANALNMAIEPHRDAKMARTADRPVPSGRISMPHAMLFGIILSVLGVAVLAIGASWAAAMVSATIVISYVALYTPLKPVTTLSTLVGAVPGALPPLVGWCAASAAFSTTGAWYAPLTDAGGWSLFALMFVWQVPHVMAISWKYRDQYAAGGYRVLPSIDPDGRRTATAALAWSSALIPVSLVPIGALRQGNIPMVGLLYAAAAVLAGVWMIWASVKLYRDRSDRAARNLFIVSIIYVPIVLFALVIDAFVPALLL